MVQGGELICIESTCPIGTAEAVARRLFGGVDVACCPERVLPGRILEELVRNDRVVGGVGVNATARAVAFYRTFVEGEVIGTDSRTAEAVKLAENAYRDVNIAFANELSMLAAEVGVDARAVIRLANRHPRVDILEPGPGVGGHCVAIDPWFLVSVAPATARLIRTAREVNLAKVEWVVKRVCEQLRPSSVVACLGLAYKADVDDLRESPSRAVADALAAVARVVAVDPYVPGTCPLDQALAEADIIVGLVAHRAFRSIRPEQLQGKVVLDFAGILP
jgi:UDP-N-acetyl-D-mannosaminuronic acid dehydrogenase